MIPIRLSIEGLYSYQKKQEIDFQRLTEAELFGIFGATGSGKSSILEAITFALYGRTERLSKKESGGTAYQMMNLKSKRLWIDFEFTSGKEEEERYRMTVESKRNRKHFDKTSSFGRKAYKWDKNSWMPIEGLDAEVIIGLSYDNFKRTIIIPQGKFQDFIELKSTERSQMLQDIFSLSKYELSGQMKSLQRKNHLQIEKTQALLNQYAAITQEVVDEQQAQTQQLEIQQKALTIQLRQLNKSREKQEQLQETFEKIAEIQKKLKQLQLQQAEVERRQEQLRRYTLCLEKFSLLISKKNETALQLRELDQSLKQHRQTYAQLSSEVKTLETTFQSIEAAYQEREQLLSAADELSQAIKLKALEATILDLDQKTKNGEQKTQEAETHLQTYEQQQTSHQKEVEQLRQQLPNTQELLAIEQWFAQQKALKERLTWVEGNMRKIQLKIQQAKREKQQWMSQTPLDRRQYDLLTEQVLQLLEAEIIRQEEKRKDLEATQQNLLVKQQLSSLAQNLEAGEPCPLCGATDHTGGMHTDVVDGQLPKLKQEMEEIHQQLKQLQHILPNLQQLAERAIELGVEYKEQKVEAQKVLTALEKHRLQFVWKAFDVSDAQAFNTHIEQVQQVQARIEHKEQQVKALQTAISEAKEKLPHFRSKLESYKMELSGKQGELASSRKSFKHIAYEDVRHHSDQELHLISTKKREQYTQAAIIYQTTLEQLKEKKDRLNVLKGKIEAEATQQTSITRQLAQFNRDLDQQLATTSFNSLEDVSETLALPIHIEAEEEFIRAFEKDYIETKTSLHNLKAQVKDQQFDAAAFEALQVEIEAKETELASLSQQIGGKKEYIRRLEAELTQKKAWQQQLQGLNLRADNLRVLESMFRGNGFVNYVSTVYLENLCAAANTRFMKLSRNALSLEVDEHNNFHVRDLLNGGKQRSIKTLSGGQTFQAALCLALALSDQVQQQAQAKQNFFFLDEGFGSLDKQSLQLIFKTLKALREENRIVGIISHVEELQQEIGAYLHIENDGEIGSIVQRSWEG